MQSFLGMRYWVQGAGEPILLLHGWGANHNSFGIISSELSFDYCVYSVDLWGFGESELPKQDATILDYAEAVYKFIIEVIGAPTLVLGHSFGGRICLILGDRPFIKGLILVDSAGLRPRLSLAQKIKVCSFLRAKRKVNAGKKDPSVLKKYGSSDYRALPNSMRGVFVRVVNHDLSDFASRVCVPTLIIWGKQDKTTNPRLARRLRRKIAHSEFHLIKGGHFSFLDSPREFLDCCKKFLINLEKKDV